MSRASVLLQLNQATRHWHVHVDEPWLDLLRPNITERDYVAQLVRMYGFEAPLESACAYTPELSRMIELRQLRHAGLIAQDLIALAMKPGDVAALPQCFSITPFTDVHEALGWLYVVERSTLHHDQVRRNLQKRIPSITGAMNYIGMSETVPDHWHRFGKTLDRIATRAGSAAKVTEAAQAAFECMHRWFQSTTREVRSSA